MSIAAKAVKGTFWIIGVSYLSFGITLFGIIILARLLMPEDFGIFAIALSLKELLFMLASFSFPVGIIQMQEEEYVANMAYILSFALGIIMIIFALCLMPILNHFFSMKIVVFFLVLSGAGLLDLIASVYSAKLQRKFEFKKFSIIRFFAFTFSIIIAVGMAFYGFGVWSLLAKDVLLAVFSCLGYRWVSCWKFHWKFEARLLKKLFKFGSNMFILRGLEVFYLRIDRLILGILGSAIIVGFYHKARYLADLGLMAVNPAILAVAFPVYARYQKDIHRFSETYKILNYFLVRVMSFALLTFLIFPKESIVILFGEKWAPAAPALRIFSIYAFLTPIYENIKNLFIAMGRISEAIKMRLFQVALLIPFLILGFLWKGLKGTASGIVLTMIMGVIVGFYYLEKLLLISFKELFKEIYRKPLIAVCFTILIFSLIKLNLSYEIAGFRTIYYIFALNLIYGFLLLIIENRKLVDNIRFILFKLKERKT